MDPLTTEEVNDLEWSHRSAHDPFIRRLFATIRDRERERDEAISRGNKVASDVGNLLGTQLNKVTAERDEEQKRADDWRREFVNRLEVITQLTKERDELQRTSTAQATEQANKIAELQRKLDELERA